MAIKIKSDTITWKTAQFTTSGAWVYYVAPPHLMKKGLLGLYRRRRKPVIRAMVKGSHGRTMEAKKPSKL